MDHKWINFDEGKSIGQKGIDGDKIIRDEENTFGARVTLEGKGDIAPASIMLGIYGIMFHTAFFSSIDHGQRCFELYKQSIDKIIHHYSIEDSERGESWTMTRNQMMDEILNVC